MKDLEFRSGVALAGWMHERERGDVRTSAAERHPLSERSEALRRRSSERRRRRDSRRLGLPRKEPGRKLLSVDRELDEEMRAGVYDGQEEPDEGGDGQ